MQPKGYIGYIRVSTVKQGTQGVSLQEQQDGIARYAERNGMVITVWFQEMVTAAKQGRPVFNQALKMLRSGRARGIILHKLDRGARNLRDWAAIGELSDQGIEVHFVSESLDLQSRGGRLSADIQAVVAADYIRNLKDETRKGQTGRLKQGMIPWGAPLGYLNNGKGKLKTPDPLKGPLVRKAFELYATGRFTLETLSPHLYQAGLRNHVGKIVDQEALSIVLRNSFYFGLIHVRSRDETHLGKHEPLISRALFESVQDALRGKYGTRLQRHDFIFSRLLSCKSCGFTLIGEIQKGRVYYRCHEKQCPQTTIREDTAAAATKQFLDGIKFTDQQKASLAERIRILAAEAFKEEESESANLKLQLGQVTERLHKLTDAFLDESIEKPLFQERKADLLAKRKEIQDQIANAAPCQAVQPTAIEKFLELAGNASLSYELANPWEKREMLRIATSNRQVDAKNLYLEPSIAFRDLTIDDRTGSGCPQRKIPRTFDRIAKKLLHLSRHGQLPDLAAHSGFLRYRRANDEPLGQPRQDGRFCRRIQSPSLDQI